MKKPPPYLLSALSGLLLFAAWPESPLTFLIFVAFIPLLRLERQGIRKRKFFGWVYVTMVIWNASTTWWVWNASEPGAVGAILANSVLMCIPWLGFYSVKKRMGDTAGYISLVIFWLTFEYIHLQDWGLSWPWLTLGNVFATRTSWVQWYEYTGVSGGGLWIMAVNVMLFRLTLKEFKSGHFKKLLAYSLGVLLLPFVLSLLIHASRIHTLVNTPKENVVIVQPNIDPYEKLSTGSFDAQLHKFIHLSDSSIDSNTVLVVWPETALYSEHGFVEDRLKESFFLNPLWDFLHRHPNINLLTGLEAVRIFDNKHSSSAQKIPDTERYFESYNSAALFDSTGPLAFYHKSKLVPGVETLPAFLHIIDSWFEKLGGTTNGYTGQDERTVLNTTNHSYHIAPSVCYESIYGEFMSRYVRNGANVIAVITNDGWWGNTPGYGQHENYARLRAIETRRWVIRSANTGVSCVINAEGNIVESRPWMESAVIRYQVPAENSLTFYARFGDCISKLAVLITVLFLAWNIITIIKTRTSRG
ncbi:MAG: apolipoprotein N-acyltransferase [Bacteroidetes bacterium]|nr:apolipoprotein N-acyltransferase [Bacteroidota bacterium]